MVESGRPQMTIWRMRIACWIPNTTNTHSEYVILIDLPLQKETVAWTRLSVIWYVHFVSCSSKSVSTYCCVIRPQYKTHIPFNSANSIQQRFREKNYSVCCYKHCYSAFISVKIYREINLRYIKNSHTWKVQVFYVTFQSLPSYLD